MKTKTLSIRFIPVIAGMLIFSCALIVSCKKKEGCTDSKATNYDPDAKKDCCCEYAPKKGCTDNAGTTNYDSDAKEDCCCEYALKKMDITKGTTPVQDGVIDAAEWGDAKKDFLYIKNSDQNSDLNSSPSKVWGNIYMKHDGQELWIGLEIFDDSHDANIDFGDRALVYVDKDYDRATSPQTDDFFGCVRRMDTTDSYMFQGQGNGKGNGNFNDWDTYVTQGAWTAVSSYVPWDDSIQFAYLPPAIGYYYYYAYYKIGQIVSYSAGGNMNIYKCIQATTKAHEKPTDTNYWTFVKSNPNAQKSWSVEYKIPYSDLGITAGAAKTLGMNFNTAEKWTYWPSWVADPNTNQTKQNWIHPNTWGAISSSDNWQ